MARDADSLAFADPELQGDKSLVLEVQGGLGMAYYTSYLNLWRGWVDDAIQQDWSHFLDVQRCQMKMMDGAGEDGDVHADSNSDAGHGSGGEDDDADMLISDDNDDGHYSH